MKQKFDSNCFGIPNFFLDEIFWHLTEGEIRVMLAFFRHIYTNEKDESQLSPTKISEKTGMNKRSVSRVLDRLAQKGLIKNEVLNDLGSQKTHYKLGDMFES